jgi:NTE family protein
MQAMKKARVLGLVAALLAARPLFAAAPFPCAPAERAGRPCVGIALSGGGARGLAHIGALRVIEEAGVPIDVVSGTSMGSIIGALYAMGYTPDDIERIALSLDWDELLSDRIERSQLTMKSRKEDDRYLISFPVIGGRVKLPAGLINGQSIYNLFVRLCWPALEIDDFKKLPRPFSCVATDITTGQVVVFDHGYLPDALRASMSIPSVFTPVRRGGRLLVDGGLKRSLPAEDAINLGADIVIGVDVSAGLLPAEDLETLVDILEQSMDLAEEPEDIRQQKLCTVLIAPHTRRYPVLDFSRAREFIRMGEEAAREHFDELRALADSLRALDPSAQASYPSPGGPDRSMGATVPSLRWPDQSLGTKATMAPSRCGTEPRPRLDLACFVPIHVDEVEIRGLKDVSHRFVMAELGVKPPADVTAGELETAIDRLYSSGFFTTLSYRFEETPAGRKLVIIVNENSSVLLNAGLRYDSHWGASLLLNASLRNLFEHGSQLEFDLLMSDRKRLTGEYAIHTGIRRSVGLRLDADYIDDHIDVYELSERASRWSASSIRAGFFLETFLSRVFYGGVGANLEWDETTSDIGPPQLTERREHLSFLSGELWFDTLDRSWFPRRGLILKVRTEVAGRTLEDETPFRRVQLDWRLTVPVERRVSLSGIVFVGITRGGRAPLQYQFFLGGVNSCTTFQGDRTFAFYGYRHQELSGQNALAAELGLQVEVLRRWYIGLHANAGSAVDQTDDILKQDAIRSGGAVSVGAETPVGPAEFSLSYSRRNKLEPFLSIGFLF